MPSKSKAQRNLMAAAAHNPAFAKKVGVPMKVAKEYNEADKGKKFKGGGMAKGCATKLDAKMIAKKEVKGHESSMHKMKKGGIVEKGTGEKYSSKAAMMRHEMKESKSEEKKEHSMKKTKKMAMGGPTLPTQAAQKATEAMSRRPAMPDKSNAGGAMRGLERAAAMSGKDFSGMGKPAGMKKGGACKKYAKGGGIEVRGKTKGRII